MFRVGDRVEMVAEVWSAHTGLPCPKGPVACRVTQVAVDGPVAGWREVWLGLQEEGREGATFFVSEESVRAAPPVG
jgi:hypothetical protein